MKKNVKICDKCKKEIVETNYFYTINKYKHFYEYNDQIMFNSIICEKCLSLIDVEKLLKNLQK